MIKAILEHLVKPLQTKGTFNRNGHCNETVALKIIYTRPIELTIELFKSLIHIHDREGYTEQKLNIAISEWINEKMAVDTITLIRRYAILSTLISHEDRIRRAVDKLKKAHNFTK